MCELECLACAVLDTACVGSRAGRTCCIGSAVSGWLSCADLACEPHLCSLQVAPWAAGLVSGLLTVANHSPLHAMLMSACFLQVKCSISYHLHAGGEVEGQQGSNPRQFCFCTSAAWPSSSSLAFGLTCGQQQDLQNSRCLPAPCSLLAAECSRQPAWWPSNA